MKLKYLLLLVSSTTLTGCVTTTMTKPDGTVVRTSTSDPAALQAIAAGLAQGAVEGAVQSLPRGFAK